MYRAIIITSAVLPLALASANDTLTWCHNNEASVCLSTGISQSCYNCLHPIEAACPGKSHTKEFEDCLCAIPSDKWTAVKACINNPATGCADDNWKILRGFEASCSAKRTELQKYSCNAEHQKEDDVLSELACLVCDGSEETAPHVSVTKTSQTATRPTGHPTSKAPVHTSKVTSKHVPTVTNKPPMSTGHGHATNTTLTHTTSKPTPNKPYTHGNCHTGTGVVTVPTKAMPPVVTGGATAMGVSMGMILAGIIASTF